MASSSMSAPFLHASSTDSALTMGLSRIKAETQIDVPSTSSSMAAIARCEQNAKANQRALLVEKRAAYGMALPASQTIERQMLAKIGASQRLPGLPTSYLGYQALTGELDRLPHAAQFSNMEGRVAAFFHEPEVAPAIGSQRDGAGGQLVGGLHQAMEQRLGL
ncbi:proteasome maturation factor UMP1 [Pseudoscourfieldia marina]|mmetsp:Transcript_13746/g.34330  ORF Transcript_13746/g.34330 Transcript_13746/m.34330 type:complete len:163 (+) Transcript_13746:19-507(+)